MRFLNSFLYKRSSKAREFKVVVIFQKLITYKFVVVIHRGNLFWTFIFKYYIYLCK